MSGTFDTLAAGTVLLAMLGLVSPWWLVLAVPWLCYEAFLHIVGWVAA